MPDTLNADEVNALMSAISEGQVDPSDPAGPGGAAPKKVTHYDLTSQDRVIRGQMPTLDAINEQVASMFGMGLAGRTRLPIRVASSPATLLKFSDVQTLLAPPAVVCVIALGTGSGQALIVLEPGLIDALLAAALGDRKARTDDISAEPRRELTSVERQVLRRLLGIFTEAMGIAWKPVMPLRPEVIRFESDPRLAVIAPPNEASLLCAFELSGGVSGRLQLAFPYSVVEPAKKLLSAAPRIHSLGDNRFASDLAFELMNVTVELRAVLGETSLHLSRLLELEVGDLLTLNYSESQPLPVYVEGMLKLTGKPTVVNGGIGLIVEQGPAASVRGHNASTTNSAARSEPLNPEARSA